MSTAREESSEGTSALLLFKILCLELSRHVTNSLFPLCTYGVIGPSADVQTCSYNSASEANGIPNPMHSRARTCWETGSDRGQQRGFLQLCAQNGLCRSVCVSVCACFVFVCVCACVCMCACTCARVRGFACAGKRLAKA
jgi:hypothetical protein